MITGVSRLGLSVPASAAQPRATGPTANSTSGSVRPPPAGAEHGTDDRVDLYRQFETLGVAARQFSGILSRIESFDLEIE